MVLGKHTYMCMCTHVHTHTHSSFRHTHKPGGWSEIQETRMNEYINTFWKYHRLHNLSLTIKMDLGVCFKIFLLRIFLPHTMIALITRCRHTNTTLPVILTAAPPCCLLLLIPSHWKKLCLQCFFSIFQSLSLSFLPCF